MEEAAAGRKVIQYDPGGFLKKTADSKESENFWFSVRPDTWQDHCLMIPRKCPSARTFRFRNYGTVSNGGEIQLFFRKVLLYSLRAY
jgi:hypothetical protein